MSLRSLRRSVGVVQQDVYLFAGTVFDNIQYGKPGASLEEIVAAAKQANAHDFIMGLPDGYHTDIGQRGVKLSGGQKQRLSIARVFLKNPPVLIFDEATSSLDNESEKVVQNSLEVLAQNRTTFVIAHRLSTIRNARSASWCSPTMAWKSRARTPSCWRAAAPMPTIYNLPGNLSGNRAAIRRIGF